MDRTKRYAFIFLLITFCDVTSATWSYDPVKKSYANNYNWTLTAIPGDIPSDVQSVDISWNYCSNCTNIPSLSALTKLNLAYNQLTQFPDLRPVRSTLTSVDLKNNDISSVRSDYADLPALLELVLESNRLDQFPNLTEMTSLETLKLSYNDIGYVPKELLTPLERLISLYMLETRISTLPDVYMPHLKNLYLRGNEPMTDLPVWTTLGQTVTHLILGQTNISSAALRAMPNLVFFILDAAGLTSFPPVVDANHKLQTFLLKCNKIGELPSNIFTALPNLTTFYVDDNLLETFPDVTSTIPAHIDIRLVRVYSSYG